MNAKIPVRPPLLADVRKCSQQRQRTMCWPAVSGPGDEGACASDVIASTRVRGRAHPPLFGMALPRIRLALSALLFSWIGAAGGADYEVEVLVYAHLQRDGGDERWPIPREWPAVERAVSLGEAGTRHVDQRALQAIADNLRGARHYRPILHWRWRQPGWQTANAKPIHVQIPAGSPVPVVQPAALLDKNLLARLRTLVAQRQPPPADQPLLDGTVTLGSAQFPLLSVDLVYMDNDTGLPVQLRETRRVREGELHYLDNPRFGVLAQVSSVR